ncbi:MAG: NTP transferase domain-containing protein [Candidatus Hodarchaeota archaeon]
MNAIILAAGTGSRLALLTKDTPKALLPVNKLAIVEYQIHYLREIGVCNISIVTGHLAHKFGYLTEKYARIELIYNNHYANWNNFYSMYLSRHRLIGNTYVIDGDTYLKRNFLSDHTIDKSCYFIGFRTNNKNEWSPDIDKEGRVVNLRITSSPAFRLIGVSYWTRRDAQIIVNLLNYYYESTNDWKRWFWDDVPKLHLEQLQVTTKIVEENDWMEIDTLEDYIKLEQKERLS